MNMVQKTQAPCWIENDVGDKKNKNYISSRSQCVFASLLRSRGSGRSHASVGAGSLRDSGQPNNIPRVLSYPSRRLAVCHPVRCLLYHEIVFCKRPIILKDLNLFTNTCIQFICKDKLVANYRVHQLMNEVEALDLLKFSFNNSF